MGVPRGTTHPSSSNPGGSGADAWSKENIAGEDINTPPGKAPLVGVLCAELLSKRRGGGQRTNR